MKSIVQTATEINNHHHQLADGIKQNKTNVNKDLASPSPLNLTLPLFIWCQGYFLSISSKCHHVRSGLNYLYGDINHRMGMIYLSITRAV